MTDPPPVNWLLLRGLVRERGHWADFPERLVVHTGGVVLTLDLPGVGTERMRPAPMSIAATVSDLRARFLTARAPHESGAEWRIFAPSLGGMIALAWAEAHPSDFAAIAVCNTSARNLAGPFQRLLPAAIRTILRGLFTFEPLARERLVLALVSNTEHGRAHAESFARLATASPIGRFVFLRQLFAASLARAPAALTLPLLVLCSEGDRLCSPGASRALASRLGARLAVHPDAGHDLPLDDPDWVIDRLTEAGERGTTIR